MAALAAYVEGIGLLGPGIGDWPAGHACSPARRPGCAHRRCCPCLSACRALSVGAPAPLCAWRWRSGWKRPHAPAPIPRPWQRYSLPPAATVRTVTRSARCWLRQSGTCRPPAFITRCTTPPPLLGIATGATPACNALCAYDASFAAGLLEALTQVAVERTAVLLIAYDAGYPEPWTATAPLRMPSVWPWCWRRRRARRRRRA